MNNKLLMKLSVIACVLCCSIVLFACTGDGSKDIIGVHIGSVDNPSETVNEVNIGEFVYGENDKINSALDDLKFYRQFGNGEYEEATVGELNVKYEKDGETLSEKPTTFTSAKQGEKSNYRFTYGIDGGTKESSVTFTVGRAVGKNFSVTLSKNTWKYGEDTATVTVKNPSGAVVNYSQSYFEGSGLNGEDTDYASLQLFAIEKRQYDEKFSADSTYGNYIGANLNKYEENSDFYLGDYTEGEYVLIACIDKTHNYKEIVCTAEFTITAPDSPIGKTFILTDLTASGEGDNPAPEEIALMAEALKEGNLGKTAICNNNGKVTGTCDFGFGEFGELTGDEEFTLTFDPQTLKVLIQNESGLQFEGAYSKQKLTLRVEGETEDEEPYSFYFTFMSQTVLQTV